MILAQEGNTTQKVGWLEYRHPKAMNSTQKSGTGAEKTIKTLQHQVST
jgi:hypothetical protein